MGIKNELKTKESDVVKPISAKAVHPDSGVDKPISPADAKVIAPAGDPAQGLSEADLAVVDVPGRTLTDADVITGFDLGKEVSLGAADPELEAPVAPAAAKPAPTPEPVATQPAKTYKVRGKTFGSAEEMAAFIEGIDQNTVNILEALQPAAAKEPVEPNPEDIFFEDPKRALAIHEKRILAKLAAESEGKERIKQQALDQQKTWASFFTANPDLVGFEEIVEKQVQSVVAELGDMPLEKGLPLVAERTRARVAKIKERLLPAEKLSSSPAVTSGASPTSAKPKPTAPVSTSFIQELKGLKKRA